jgi:hypothetical protein
MTGPALGSCPVCGIAVYLTKAGKVRRHDAKVDGVPRYQREACPGSGQAPAAVLL